MTDKRISIRPILKVSANKEGVSISEAFQNITIRPIIKLQHHLILAIFKEYAVLRKIIFNDLAIEKKVAFIENSLLKDAQLKKQFIGIIMGHFTVEEYQKYATMKSEVHKRIINIIKKRLTDSLNELSS